MQFYSYFFISNAQSTVSSPIQACVVISPISSFFLLDQIIYIFDRRAEIRPILLSVSPVSFETRLPFTPTSFRAIKSSSVADSALYIFQQTTLFLIPLCPSSSSLSNTLVADAPPPLFFCLSVSTHQHSFHLINHACSFSFPYPCPVYPF